MSQQRVPFAGSDSRANTYLIQGKSVLDPFAAYDICTNEIANPLEQYRAKEGIVQQLVMHHNTMTDDLIALEDKFRADRIHEPAGIDLVERMETLNDIAKYTEKPRALRNQRAENIRALQSHFGKPNDFRGQAFLQILQEEGRLGQTYSGNFAKQLAPLKSIQKTDDLIAYLNDAIVSRESGRGLVPKDCSIARQLCKDNVPHIDIYAEEMLRRRQHRMLIVSRCGLLVNANMGEQDCDVLNDISPPKVTDLSHIPNEAGLHVLSSALGFPTQAHKATSTTTSAPVETEKGEASTSASPLTTLPLPEPAGQLSSSSLRTSNNSLEVTIPIKVAAAAIAIHDAPAPLSTHQLRPMSKTISSEASLPREPATSTVSPEPSTSPNPITPVVAPRRAPRVVSAPSTTSGRIFHKSKPLKTFPSVKALGQAPSGHCSCNMPADWKNRVENEKTMTFSEIGGLLAECVDFTKGEYALCPLHIRAFARRLQWNVSSWKEDELSQVWATIVTLSSALSSGELST